MALYKGSNKVAGSAGAGFNPGSGTTGQILTKTESGYDWEDAPATGVQSSNDTYEDIVYLSQSDYDALQNKDPNTLYSTPDGEGGEPFEPSNVGTTGQVLTKTALGYDWETVDALPSGGTTGQVLTKTASGADWQTPAASGIVCDPNSPIQIDKIRVGTEDAYFNLSSYSEGTAYLTV